MAKRALSMSTLEGYSGYGPEQGEKPLRVALAKTFYDNLGIEEDDIFVSDDLAFRDECTSPDKAPGMCLPRFSLEKTHVVTTPGSGFGPDGEGFIRVSAFGHRENILEACKRFKQLYK